jgi:hypothetical protein
MEKNELSMTAEGNAIYTLSTDPSAKVLTIAKEVKYKKGNDTMVSDSTINVPLSDVGKIAYGDDVSNGNKGNGDLSVISLLAGSLSLIGGVVIGLFGKEQSMLSSLVLVLMVIGLVLCAAGIYFYPRKKREFKHGFAIYEKNGNEIVSIDLVCIDKDLKTFIDRLRANADGKDFDPADKDPNAKPKKHLFGK